MALYPTSTHMTVSFKEEVIRRRCLNRWVLSECSIELLVCWTKHLWLYLLPFTHQLRSDQSRYRPGQQPGAGQRTVPPCIPDNALYSLRRKLKQKLPRWSEIPYFTPQIIPTVFSVYTSYAKHILWLCFHGEYLLSLAPAVPRQERARHAILTILKAPANALSSSSCLLVVSVPRLNTLNTLPASAFSSRLDIRPLEHLPAHSSVHSHHSMHQHHHVNIIMTTSVRTSVPGASPSNPAGNNYFNPSLNQYDSIWIDSYESEWFIWIFSLALHWRYKVNLTSNKSLTHSSSKIYDTEKYII